MHITSRFISILIPFFLVTICLGSNGNSYINNNYIWATVNGVNIYSYDIETRIKILSLLDPNFKYPDKNYKISLLNQMIDEYLITEDTKNYNISVSKKEVEDHIHYIESLNKWEKNEIYKKMIKFNLTKNNIDDYFYNQYLIQKFIQSIGFSRTQLNSSEFNKAYYNLLTLNGKTQYLISEIFISSTNKSLDTVKQQVNSIYTNLKNGANFNLLVLSYSENIYSKNKKGLVGWVFETQLTEEAVLGLNSIKKNEFTKPIQMEDGFYIFKLIDKSPIIYINTLDTQSTSRLKSMLKEKILNEKAQVYISSYISNLKNRAIINYCYK